MCRGDDPSCSEFELHHRQFVEDMARERRSFLASRFAAKGGVATLTAGGLALPKRSRRRRGIIICRPMPTRFTGATSART